MLGDIRISSLVHQIKAYISEIMNYYTSQLFVIYLRAFSKIFCPSCKHCLELLATLLTDPEKLTETSAKIFIIFSTISRMQLIFIGPLTRPPTRPPTFIQLRGSVRSLEVMVVARVINSFKTFSLIHFPKLSKSERSNIFQKFSLHFFTS